MNRIKKTTEWLKRNPIKCDRYSNKLDEKIYVPHTYTSKIQLSSDGNQLILMIKKFTIES